MFYWIDKIKVITAIKNAHLLTSQTSSSGLQTAAYTVLTEGLTTFRLNITNHNNWMFRSFLVTNAMSCSCLIESMSNQTPPIAVLTLLSSHRKKFILYWNIERDIWYLQDWFNLSKTLPVFIEVLRGTTSLWNLIV